LLNTFLFRKEKDMSDEIKFVIVDEDNEILSEHDTEAEAKAVIEEDERIVQASNTEKELSEYASDAWRDYGEEEASSMWQSNYGDDFMEEDHFPFVVDDDGNVWKIERKKI
jgi:hypothetical protein